MQIFLPHDDFQKTARCLDDVRLGNQCYRECKTLLNGGWKHHPVAKMWRDYTPALCWYALQLAIEMGKRNKWKPEVVDRWQLYYNNQLAGHKIIYPPWIGDERLHSSHRSRLLFKGKLDILSKRIKSGFPKYPVNKWLKDNKYPELNTIREKEYSLVSSHLDSLSIPALNIANHYSQFGWKEPDNLEYYWPV